MQSVQQYAYNMLCPQYIWNLSRYVLHSLGSNMQQILLWEL